MKEPQENQGVVLEQTGEKMSGDFKLRGAAKAVTACAVVIECI